MIALLVIALGMGAVINTTTEAGWKATHLKQSTIANWVAYNQIALYRAKRVWDGKSRLGGDTEMANVEWTWEMEISGTDDGTAPSTVNFAVYREISGEERLIGVISYSDEDGGGRVLEVR